METPIKTEAEAMIGIKDYLDKSGWTISYRTRRAIDAAETPLAWWSYPALDFLGQRIDKSMSVFEYGCGYSTIWLATRAKKITSVENNLRWCERVQQMLPVNATVSYAEDANFAKAITLQKEKFNIVVIDGHDRCNCARECIPMLADDGIIIHDNAGGRWTEGLEFLTSQGFRRIDFCGLAPICTYAVRTAILYRPNNCFNI